jgi:hypothetical protein
MSLVTCVSCFLGYGAWICDAIANWAGTLEGEELGYGDWICDAIANWVGTVEGEEVQRPT